MRVPPVVRKQFEQQLMMRIQALVNQTNRRIEETSSQLFESQLTELNQYFASDEVRNALEVIREASRRMEAMGITVRPFSFNDPLSPAMQQMLRRNRRPPYIFINNLRRRGGAKVPTEVEFKVFFMRTADTRGLSDVEAEHRALPAELLTIVDNAREELRSITAEYLRVTEQSEAAKRMTELSVIFSDYGITMPEKKEAVS